MCVTVELTSYIKSQHTSCGVRFSLGVTFCKVIDIPPVYIKVEMG